MTPIDVLATDPMEPTTLAVLDRTYRLHHWWEADDPDSLLAEVGPRVRGMATSYKVGASASLIDRLPILEIIANFGVGYDRVDVEHARRRAIRVTNTPDVLTDDVADLAIALWLGLCRRIVAADRFVRSGKWLEGAFPLAETTEKRRVGILGMGRIGRAIAARARSFKAEIAYSQPRRPSGVEDRYEPDPIALAAWADVLFVAVPGGAATAGLVGRAILDSLGSNGLLINIARGSIVDEAELVSALAEGRLGGAGLDVFAREPAVPAALLDMENVILLPHVASATHATRRAMGQLVIDNLAAHFAGRPLPTPVA